MVFPCGGFWGFDAQSSSRAGPCKGPVLLALGLVLLLILKQVAYKRRFTLSEQSPFYWAPYTACLIAFKLPFT